MDNKYNVDDILNEIKRKKSERLAGIEEEAPVYHPAKHTDDGEYVPKHGIDTAVVLYSVPNFVSDSNLVWLAK